MPLAKFKYITLAAMLFALVTLILLLLTVKARLDATETKLAAKQIELTAALDDVLALQSQMEEQRAKIAAFNQLSTRYSEELANAKAEIQQLSDNVRAGPKRVYVKASCPPAVPSADSAGSVGDAGSARLSDTAREDYLRLRMMMVENEKQTKYLQDYIRTQCLRAQ